MRRVSGCISKRRKTGTNGGKRWVWVARVPYVDARTGKRRELTRHATTQSEAKDLLPALLRQAGVNAPSEHRGRTFRDLARFYCEHYAIEPRVVGETEAVGIVSWKDVRQIVNDVLVPTFGNQRVAAITFGQIRQFRAERFATPTQHRKQRSVRRVNAELSTLRHVLYVAVDEGWISTNPMAAIRGGRTRDPLIRPSEENHRTRVLTRDEELRLLAACTGKRAHLRSILIVALDTGMRSGEIRKMKWRDVEMDRGAILIPVANAKSRRARVVPITKRVRAELEALAATGMAPESQVFGSHDWKRAFSSARREAGIGADFTFHSTRHTAATRLAGAPDLSALDVAQIVGHSSLMMTRRYVHGGDELLSRAATALDRLAAQPSL